MSSIKLRILHVVLSIGETNATYNEHCLPLMEERDISICTFFKPTIQPPPQIRVFEGDGTLKGFMRTLSWATSTRQYDIIHAHSPHVALLILAAMPKNRQLAATPTLLTVHDSFPNYKLRNRLLLVPVFAGLRSIVCCSKVSRESFPGIYKVLAGKRLCAVQNGMDIARVDRIAAEHQPAERSRGGFEVVAISRLLPIKNPSAVIGAFVGGADEASRLTYIGDGALRDQLRAEAGSSSRAGQITFTGLIPRNQVYEHLLGADLFISASRGEGLPISVLEAMACRRPVLLSDIPPHREIAEGVDFIPLVKPDDVQGFAREIRKFREMSAEERATIGQKCRQVVESRFSLHAMHSGYAQVYAGLMSGQMPPVWKEAG